MKNIYRFKLISFVLLVAYLLSACAGAAATATSVGAGKPVAHPVTYLGVIEGISGDQWTINGLTLTVTSDIVRDGPFAVGDQIKVEALVNPDGSLSISRVEAASADDLSTLPGLGDDNSNANSNDDNTNDANSNDDDLNSNDDNTNDANSNDVLNSNDDNTNTSNSNDDANSNDDNSNDDNGNDSNSNDDDDDSGSNSNDDDDDEDDDNGNDDNSNG